MENELNEKVNKHDNKEDVLKLTKQRDRASMIMTLYSVVAIMDIIVVMLLQNQLIDKIVIVDIVGILIMLICLVGFVVTGFRFTDANDAIKSIKAREKAFKNI